MKNKRHEAKKASKEALVRSAIMLFPTKGLNVSLDELCAHAGYSRGAFYVHFKNREELQMEVVEREVNTWLDNLFGSGILSNEKELSNLVLKFVADLCDGRYPVSKESGLRPHQLLEMCSRSERIRKAYLKIMQTSMERIQRIIELSQGKGLIRKDLDAGQISSLLLYLSVGVHTMYDLDYPIDFSGNTKTLLRLFNPQNGALD
ncbi:TetR/AcrR family transcriptional regulator [Veronia pacifica]|uniref:TetR/AcrR family transcriptional regulator n=1 Tax=Veronia pacifica TaxID=1080227 RepID=UPI0015865212|nr:TetR/AcrR family transcriptional regulator [Veronia pacifica]